MKVVDVDLEAERQAELELLELIAGGIREAQEKRAARPILQVVRKGGPITVSRTAWLMGELACPACGKPLDPDRDRVDVIREITSAMPTGVTVKHGVRCGWEFELRFADAGEPSV